MKGNIMGLMLVVGYITNNVRKEQRFSYDFFQHCHADKMRWRMFRPTTNILQVTHRTHFDKTF